MEQRLQKFIPGSVDTEGITALAVSGNRKFLAVAERSEKGTVTIYDLGTLKRRKVLSISELGSKEYVSLCFSPDGKMLAAQGGGPEWNLTVWIWEKSKVVATTKATSQPNMSVFECSFCPQDTTLLSVSGDGVFKVFRLVDTQLKQMPSYMGKHEPQNYSCHAWFPDEKDRVVVASLDTGDLFISEGGELKAILAGDNNPVHSIVPYSKGFICGGSNGVLTIYDKSDDKQMYKLGKTFQIEGEGVPICSLALSPSEETLICAVADNQIYQLGLSNSDILKTEEMNFELLAQPFHLKGITCVDTCVRKPLVVTCSTDRSVRVWNYQEKNAELVKSFSEEAYSVAFHPSGLHILVGFADKLRLMNLLIDDIRPFKEFGVKSCRECRFSNGGQYFAAVNGNTIQIYNTYTCENIGNLRGHNGKVRSLHWSPDDTKFVSAGLDGAIYEWSISDFKRQNENVLKSCNYSSVAASPDFNSLFAVGSDRKLKQLENAQILKEFESEVALTQVALPINSKTLFAATESGTLRSYKYPLTGEYQEFQCHSAAITGMRISFDDTMLFCVSEDACLCVFDVRDKETRAGIKRDKETLAFAEEVLVTKSDLEEKKTRMSELETQVNELTMQNEYQLRLKDLNLNEKIKDITEKFTQELETDKAKFDLLLQEKNEQEMEYEEKLKQAEENHGQAIQALETQYQHKIMGEVERYQQLQQEKEMLNARWDEQNNLLIESHERLIQELTEEYEAKLQEEQMNLERLHQERDEAGREFEESQRQLEEDADREIEGLKERYEARLTGERELGLRLKGENGIMKKKFNALQKDIDDQKDEIKHLYEQKKDLYATIASLEKDINGLKKEIKERDQTIGDKEKRIYDLKKKNQELEKFKFVLDYKIKELKKQIEPRELEIGDMREQIQQMDRELERYHKNSASLDLTISDLKLKQAGLQKEVLAQRKLNADAEAIIKRFHHDLHETVQHIQEPRALKESVKRLYQKHVTEQIEVTELEEDIQSEYKRQRDYLEKTIESLKRKLQKDDKAHRGDLMRVMNENVSLIKEINELRREIKAMKLATQTTMKRSTNSSKKADAQREVEMQREIIAQLREELEDKNGLISELEAKANYRPMSREKLPPLEPKEPDVPPPVEEEASKEGGEEEEAAEVPAAPAAAEAPAAGGEGAPEDELANLGEAGDPDLKPPGSAPAAAVEA